MAAVLTRDIVKIFGEVSAVNGISLTVPDGEFMVLLGPSGCGKTTFLRIICGLEKQTSGDLMIGGQLVNDIPRRAGCGDDVSELRAVSALHGAQRHRLSAANATHCEYRDRPKGRVGSATLGNRP